MAATCFIPPVGDRIAQTVVARHLEKREEMRFHPDPDFYGYRPPRSATRRARDMPQTLLEYDWVSTSSTAPSGHAARNNKGQAFLAAISKGL